MIHLFSSKHTHTHTHILYVRLIQRRKKSFLLLEKYTTLQMINGLENRWMDAVIALKNIVSGVLSEDILTH